MKQNRQNIYESPPPGDSNQGGSDKNPKGQNSWDEMFRQSRRSAHIFRLVILAFLVILALFVVEQMREKEARHDGGSPSIRKDQPIQMTGSDSILDFEGDIQGQLIMEELREVDPDTVPEDGDMPFNAHWIKQAAVHLLQAEKFYNMQEWEKAIYHFKKVKTIFPDIEDVDARLGLCFMRLDDFDNSAEAFTEATSHNTNSFRVINNLGVALLADEEFSKAEERFSRVLELNPDYAPAYYNKALLYYRTEMYEEAANCFEDYFSRESGNVDALQIYTKVLIELERWEDAADTLKQSAQRLPEAAPVYMALAHVLANTGDEDEAMRHLEHGVSLLDRSKALALVTSPQYDKLRQRQDFKDLVHKLAADI